MDMTKTNHETELWIDLMAARYQGRGATAPIAYRDPLDIGMAQAFLRASKFTQAVCYALKPDNSALVIFPQSADDEKTIRTAVEDGRKSAMTAMRLG